MRTKQFFLNKTSSGWTLYIVDPSHLHL